jgi:hypothetical protein
VPAADAGASYIDAIKNYVGLLNSNGIVAILDLHWTDGTYTGTGAGCSDVKATCQKPMPDSAQSVPFWTSVASTFKGDNAVIFDLFNEPYPDQALGGSTTAAWQGLLREDGQDTSLAPTALGDGPPPRCPQRGGVNDPSYRFLQSLPTDPRALLSLIYQQMQGQQPQPQEAFTTIGDMLHEAIAPPQVSAALYRAAALIPGVTVVPDATNALSRHGVAVAFQAQGVRMEWIFDRQTFQYIGEDDINVADGSTNGESAILQQAFVDHEGQLPTRSP